MERAALEAEFCPPLDSCLFEALVGERDLTTAHGVAEARSVLAQLSERAEEQQNTGFEPSGVGRPSTTNDTDRSTLVSTSLTDDTSVTQALTTLSIDSSESDFLDKLDHDTKLGFLLEFFDNDDPHAESNTKLKPDFINEKLKKNKGRWNDTLDELLAEVFILEEQAQLLAPKKGVDGFAEPRVSKKARRKRNQARRASASDSAESETSPPPPANRWQTTREDIDFISSRTSIGTISVSPLYHSQGASVSKTIRILLDKEIAKHGNKEDSPKTISNAIDLADSYHGISEAHLRSIVRITSSSESKARDLAKALITPRQNDSFSTIVPQYNKVTEQDINGSPWTVMNNKKAKPEPSASGFDYIAYQNARSRAFAQANAAHRQARSDPRFGAVAALRSETGRALGQRMHDAIAADADALVASQSSASQIDLHGVDVANAVRIAQRETQRWWDALGENRANGRVGASKRAESFRIVVGSGTHSEGGKSKLGPAVRKMLESNGWKAVHNGPAIDVTGRQRG